MLQISLHLILMVVYFERGALKKRKRKKIIYGICYFVVCFEQGLYKKINCHHVIWCLVSVLWVGCFKKKKEKQKNACMVFSILSGVLSKVL